MFSRVQNFQNKLGIIEAGVKLFENIAEFEFHYQPNTTVRNINAIALRGGGEVA